MGVEIRTSSLLPSPVIFVKFLKTPFLYDTSGQLLLEGAQIS